MPAGAMSEPEDETEMRAGQEKLRRHQGCYIRDSVLKHLHFVSCLRVTMSCKRYKKEMDLHKSD